MRVPTQTAELERWAKQIHEAEGMMLHADAFDRWGPKDDVEQRQEMERAVAEASTTRRAAIEHIERRVAELRASDVHALEAWADAHVELLDHYLGSVDADSTEAFVAKQERAKWLELRAGACLRVEQNTYYVRYDRTLYEQLFGFA